MIPLFLDPAATRIALIGRGPLAARRLAWLEAGGARPEVWSDAPSSELSTVADLRLGLPTQNQLRSYHAIWIADLPRDTAGLLATVARGAGVLVNVEDAPSLCDFHSPAVVRRGKLTLAAGTGGASPAVARAAREQLQAAFPEAWAGALDEIAEARMALRNEGAGYDALVADAKARLAQYGLV